MKIRIKAIRTKYWRPGVDYVSEIEGALVGQLDDGNIVAVSEKAIAVSMGLLVDESLVKPSALAKAIASIWMRRIWNGPLGLLTKLKQQTRKNLVDFPTMLVASHKEVALREVGFLQALRHYSEGGIDASNLPLSYVSLPLTAPSEIAEKIRNRLNHHSNVTVIIVDGDSTFSWRNLHLAPRPVKTPGLIYFGGFLQFVIGRLFQLKSRPTPIAVSGMKLNPDRALWFAYLAHKTENIGAGKTVWSMSKRFGTSLTGITMAMLDRVKHTPIIVIKYTES